MRTTWDIREYEILESMMDEDINVIAAEFKRNGINRSKSSIQNKRSECRHERECYEIRKLHATCRAEIECNEEPQEVQHETRELEAYSTEELVNELRNRGCDVTCRVIVEY